MHRRHSLLHAVKKPRTILLNLTKIREKSHQMAKVFCLTKNSFCSEKFFKDCQNLIKYVLNNEQICEKDVKRDSNINKLPSCKLHNISTEENAKLNFLKMLPFIIPTCSNPTSHDPNHWPCCDLLHKILPCYPLTQNHLADRMVYHRRTCSDRQATCYGSCYERIPSCAQCKCYSTYEKSKNCFYFWRGAIFAWQFF